MGPTSSIRPVPMVRSVRITGQQYLLLHKLLVQDERDIAQMVVNEKRDHITVSFGDGAVYALSPDGRLLSWEDGDGHQNEHPVIVSGGS